MQSLRTALSPGGALAALSASARYRSSPKGKSRQAAYMSDPKTKVRIALWREANKERVRAYGKKWRDANKAGYSAYQLEYARANREKMHAKSKKWRDANREQIKTKNASIYAANPDKARARSLAWTRDNPDKNRAHAALRRARLLRATPAWADPRAIAKIYARAVRKTRETGEPWHVDHIVPLRSKYVCGLHCEANLRVIPGAENCSKGNRHWPDKAAST